MATNLVCSTNYTNITSNASFGLAALNYNTSGNTSKVVCVDMCDGFHNVTPGQIAYALFMVVILLTSLIGNLLVVVAVLMSPSLKKRVTSKFIASLACSDFLYAALLIPFRISIQLHDSRFCHSVATCYWYIISDVFCNTASIMNLLVLALDRFFAIKFPFRYTDWVTQTRGKKVLAFLWFFAAMMSWIGIFDWTGTGSVYITRLCGNMNRTFYLAVFLGVYVTSLIIITIVYFEILHIALSHIKSIEKTSSMHKWENNNKTGKQQGKKKNLSRKRRREWKTTKSLAIVYGTFVICWLPSCIIVTINNIDTNFFYNFKVKNYNAFMFTFYAFIEVLPVLNTALNPFIYSFSNKQFRSAFKRVLYKLCRQQLPRDFENVSLSYGDSRRKKSSLGSMIGELGRLSQRSKVSQSSTHSSLDMFSNGFYHQKSRGWSQTSLNTNESNF